MANDKEKMSPEQEIAALKAKVAALEAEKVESDQLISELSEKLATVEKSAKAGAPVVKVGKQSYKFRFPSFYNPLNPLQKLSAADVAANADQHKDLLAKLTETTGDSGKLRYGVLEPIA